MSQETPEFTRPTTIHGNDPELTKAVEKADDGERRRREWESQGHYAGGMDHPFIAPEDHVQGEPIIGIPINENFNKGIQHGPWKASRTELDRYVANGFSEDEGQQLHGLMATQRAAGINTYPFSDIGESGEIRKEANKEYDDIVKKVGKRVRGQIEKEEAA